ncbi:uncharacterized protein THITE_75460 [Thermothielavioides terrestris NRRL 8126]|uniref:Chromosome transmission fidelity protein 4 n=1 Tax=Thermothielavioides terrestris (strain ATCC 38088 / NRRL 8126) TaxID=578455 RepID=G2RHZ8_THETT|nr:uncharacterized protein THITE_75460 [Thermothielavioides terrestris NRRL 8126]AEO71460.1 hypothetical protein THITE_75460 [Thermothielavioides terrestris NRRL 8126]
MSAPTRIPRCRCRCRCPLHGHTVRTASKPWRHAAAAISQQRQPCAYPPSPLLALHLSTTASRALPRPSPCRKAVPTLHDSNIRQEPLPAVWFTAHRPLLSHDPTDKPPDPRKVKLGKTLRILQERLPTLLQTPLPQEVLSPHITLHLFPSTHPHLPTVTGRVAYIAALWSSPIAWNRVPLVGNVRLEILSARMVDHPGACGEQLVVRWRTVGGGGRIGKKGLLGFGAGAGDGDSAETEVKAPVGMAQPVGASDKEFTGLFIFDFDSEGRILSHTIENVQEGGQWEKGVGAKVVGLTDWLLGGIKGGDAPCPAFARARFRKGRS